MTTTRLQSDHPIPRGESDPARRTTDTGEAEQAQHAATAFYERHGLVEVQRFGPYANIATSVCMQRDLGFIA